MTQMLATLLPYNKAWGGIMEDEYTRAVRELYYWQFGSNPTNFAAKLFDLIEHADLRNRSRLCGAFPMEFAAWNDWQKAPDANVWFREYLELPV